MASIEVLEYAINEVKRKVEMIEVNLREVIQQLGKLQGLSAATELKDIVHEQMRINMKQERELGSIAKALEQLKEALLHSSDRSLREAAKGVTINIGDGADIKTMQTGSSSSVDEKG
jgi:hypothetical protein